MIHSRVALLLLAIALFGVRIDNPLLEPEEARYAEIPRQMLDQGRFLDPVLHGEDYFQKPPLLYWLIELAYSLFGVHDWSARLVPALAGVGTVTLVCHWGGRSGLLAGTILLLSPRWLYQARMVSFDSLLAFWIVLAWMFAHSRRWRLSALACGLGILTKGPIALLLALGPAILSDMARGRWQWRRWILYSAIASLVAGLWFLQLAWRNPQALMDMVWVHHVKRLVDPIDHSEPVWFFLPYLGLGMMPWSLGWGAIAWNVLWRAGKVSDRRRSRFSSRLRSWLAMGNQRLDVWCVIVVVVFFSLSGCKRPGYVLPAYPALALVLGHWASRLQLQNWLPMRAATVSTALGLFALFLFASPSYHRHFGMREQLLPHEALVRREGLQLASFPRRWDSISFYLRDAVKLLEPEKLARPTLLLVRKRDLSAMEAKLPGGWTFRPLGVDGSQFVTGVLQPRGVLAPIGN